MAKEVLTIFVRITDSYIVEGSGQTANMVSFTGRVDCENFTGIILPHGVDTQKKTGDRVTLSARYMLEGKDADGVPCHIFIENNGASDDPRTPIRTTPVIVTDSPRLKWLEEARLFGTIEPLSRETIYIHIFAEE